MNYSIAIYGGPYSDQSAHSALHFAKAALLRNHSIQRVFFYHDGVYNSSVLVSPPQDETNVSTQWQDLAKDHNIELVVCIAAAFAEALWMKKKPNATAKVLTIWPMALLCPALVS